MSCQSRRKVLKLEQAQKDVGKLLPVFQRQEFQAMQKQGIRGHKQFLIDTHRERVNAVVCWSGPLHSAADSPFR